MLQIPKHEYIPQEIGAFFFSFSFVSLMSMMFFVYVQNKPFPLTVVNF